VCREQAVAIVRAALQPLAAAAGYEGAVLLLHVYTSRHSQLSGEFRDG
jgi:hypothetical protein